MNFPRLDKFLQLRYPQSLHSQIGTLRSVVLYVDIEYLAREVISLNTQSTVYSREKAMEKVCSTALQVYDLFHPESIVFYTNRVINPESYKKEFINERYYEKYCELNEMQVHQPMSVCDFIPKSIFMRDLLKRLIGLFLPYVGRSLLKMECFEDFDVVKNMSEQPVRELCYCLGLQQQQKLQILMSNIPVKEITRSKDVFEKQIPDIYSENVDFFQFGVIIEDYELLRECIFCDFFKNYLNDNQKLEQLAFQIDGDVKNKNASVQEEREVLYESKCFKEILKDFVLLVILTGSDALPELPGQTSKNGVLDEFIELYMKQNMETYPFIYLFDEESNELQYEYLAPYFDILVKEQNIYIVNDVKDTLRLSKISIQHEEFRESVINDVNRLRSQLPEQELQKINTTHANKLVADKAFSQIFKWYLYKYYGKVGKFEEFNENEMLLDIDSVSFRNFQFLALYDYYLNAQQDKNEQLLKEIQPLLQQFDKMNEYTFSIEFIRQYLLDIQSLLMSILNNKVQVIENKHAFAPSAQQLAGFCRLASAESQNSTIADLLWEYKGPIYVSDDAPEHEPYLHWPKQMLQHFIAQFENEVTQIDGIAYISTESPFYCANQFIGEMTPGKYILKARNQIFAQDGFHLIQGEEGHALFYLQTNDMFTTEDLLLSKQFEPIRIEFGKQMNQAIEYSQVFASLSDEAFELQNGVLCGAYEKSFPLFKGVTSNKPEKLELENRIFELPTLLFETDKLQLLQSNIYSVNKEISEFSIIYPEYESPTLVFSYQANECTTAENDCLFSYTGSRDLLQREIISENIFEDILDEFDAAEDQLLKEDVLYQATDIFGKIFGIVTADTYIEVENNEFLDLSFEYSSEQLQQIMQDMVDLTVQYFYLHKGYKTEQVDIIILLERPYTEVGSFDIEQCKVAKKKDIFIEACSIFDELSVVPVPLQLLSVNEAQIINSELLSGSFQLFEDEKHLKHFLGKYQYQDVTTDEQIISLELDPSEIQAIAQQLQQQYGMLVPAMAFRDYQSESVAIVQRKMSPVSQKFFKNYGPDYSSLATKELVVEELGVDPTDFQLQNLLHINNINTVDNGVRQFGLGAVFESLVDVSLFNGGLTYKGLFILLLFQKAFPQIFSAVLGQEQDQQLNEKDVYALSEGSSIYSATKPIVYSSDLPILEFSDVVRSIDVERGISDACRYMASLPVERRFSVGEERALPVDQIIYIERHFDPVATVSEFALNIYEPKRPLCEAQLLSVVYIEDVGIGVVVSAAGRRLSAIVDGHIRGVDLWTQRVWQLQNPLPWKCDCEFQSLRMANEIHLEQPMDRWFGYHFEIELGE